MGGVQTKEVSSKDLQTLFNSWVASAPQGYTITVKKEFHPSRPKAREPFCTRSQMIAYIGRNGKVKALAHRYLRKDGKIGASGKPDPKYFYENGVIYKLSH